ncbi:MAG: hypothetical protein J6Z18_08465 [Prevotella sp.]|nr:hypothetical protein [Prevotella sp.]
MKNNKTIIYLRSTLVFILMTVGVSLLYASDMMPADTVIVTDSAKNMMRADSAIVTQMAMQDTIHLKKRDWSTWRPDIKRAMWLAIVFPGGGQIYNRKYWKLPIVYGGFIGCYYAIRWNNMMYKDYSQAYLDLMDDNPETQSYNQFMHFGTEITEANKSTYENKFRRRKDYYRRYRDLSSFIMIGVYALSIIDAYVDASLSEFDISDDLSMRVTPTVMADRKANTNPLKSTALGVHCSLSF